MVEQIELSITSSEKSFKAIEKSSHQQRALSLVSLGTALDEEQFFEKALKESKDDNFKKHLEDLIKNKKKNNVVIKRDLLELASAAEDSFVSSQLEKEESWSLANRNFSKIISGFKSKSNALFVMQVFTLLCFLTVLLFQRMQQKAKERMGRQERLQSKLFSSLSEGVFLCSGEGKVLACNSSGSFIMGKEARFMAGKEFTSLFKDMSLQTDAKRSISGKDFFNKIIQEGRTLTNFTISISNRSGHMNWYNVTSQPISPFTQGETFNMLISFNNITEKINAQDVVKKQQAEMMEGSKLRTIGEMAGGIAHEIDNPLSIISATTERLDWKAERKGNVDGEIIRKSTGKVLKTVERISAIVKSLLALAREEEVDHQFVPIQEVLNIAFDLANIEIARNQIDLKINSEHLQEVVQCFPTQIAQVLLNLTKNSIDAIENLDNKWISLDVTDEGDHFKFVHSDAGSGVPKEVVHKMMMPFFTTKAMGKGTGLGLSISRTIITAHHGEFYVDCEAENTTFVFTLPKKFIEKEIDEEEVITAA